MTSGQSSPVRCPQRPFPARLQPLPGASQARMLSLLRQTLFPRSTTPRHTSASLPRWPPCWEHPSPSTLQLLPSRPHRPGPPPVVLEPLPASTALNQHACEPRAALLLAPPRHRQLLRAQTLFPPQCLAHEFKRSSKDTHAPEFHKILQKAHGYENCAEHKRCCSEKARGLQVLRDETMGVAVWASVSQAENPKHILICP